MLVFSMRENKDSIEENFGHVFDSISTKNILDEWIEEECFEKDLIDKYKGL